MVRLDTAFNMYGNVPHFKGLIDAKVDLEAQGHDTTFTLCHAQ